MLYYINYKFKICSVAEDNYESDRLSSVATSFLHRTKYYRKTYEHRDGSDKISHKTTLVTEPTTLKISVTANNKLIVRLSTPDTLDRLIEFNDIDIDSLIEYLNDAKVFVEEMKLINKLKGNG